MKIIYEKKEYFLIFWVLFLTVLNFISQMVFSWSFFVDNYLYMNGFVNVIFANMIFILMYTSEGVKKAVVNLVFYLLLLAGIYGISFHIASVSKLEFLYFNVVLFSKSNVILILSTHLVLRFFYFQRKKGKMVYIHFKDSTSYEGYLINGLANHSGTYTDINGVEYSGKWKNGRHIKALKNSDIYPGVVELPEKDTEKTV